MDVPVVFSSGETGAATRAGEYARGRDQDRAQRAQVEAVLQLHAMVATYGAPQVRAWLDDVRRWRA
jgi:hypothetical protein